MRQSPTNYYSGWETLKCWGLFAGRIERSVVDGHARVASAKLNSRLCYCISGSLIIVTVN